MIEKTLVGKKVVVINKDLEPELIGKAGKIVGALGTWYNQIIYKIEFDFNVGQYTHGGKPGKFIGLPVSFIKVIEEKIHPDFDTLINLALDTNDKEWFECLVHQKNILKTT